ncbi:MAG: BrnT family toxin [Proteobacteria bacterium]|nr:BrnT family toxin [Pseudomonadota bacterium]
MDQSPHGRDGHAPFFRDAKSNFKETLVLDRICRICRNASVIITLRDEKIRIISARRSRKNEIKYYKNA